MAASTTAAFIVSRAASITSDHRLSASYTDADHLRKPMLQSHLCPTLSLVPPSARHGRRRRPPRVLRLFQNLCRTLPVFTPKCKVANSCCLSSSSSSASAVVPIVACSATPSPVVLDSRCRRHNNIVTGTLFGYRKGRVSFSIQEDPGCLPSLVVELPMQSHALLREMSAGMVRIALECDKKPPENSKDRQSSSSSNLLDEPIWTMFCNAKKTGYGVRREASEEDLSVMETLRAVSMGAGVLPGKSEVEGPEGEMAYVRAGFDHVIVSKDSETLYMMSPEDGHGPDLTIFFVRL